MNEISVPLVSMTPEDSRAYSFGPLVPNKLPKPKNFAEVETLQGDLREIYSLVTWTRQARMSLTEDWMAIRRMDLMQHDEGKRYNGRSNVYIPAANRNFDTIVASLSRGLFPSDDFMDVVNRDGDVHGDEKAKKVKAVIQWEFESNAFVRREMKPLLRQFAQYGTTMGKYQWRKQQQVQGKLTFDGQGSYGGIFDKNCVDGLQFTTRNIFNWHIYPMTAANLDEASLVFEDVDVPLSFIKAQLKSKRWLNEQSALNAGINSTADLNQQQLKEDMHVNTLPNSSNPSGASQSDMKTFTEVWTYLVLPSDGYAEGEDKTGPVPVKIVFTSNGDAVEVIRNPHWDQRAPYVISRLNTQPGFFYGYGFGQKMRSMQYLINDFANQTNDVGIYALNPVLKVNPGMLAGPLAPLRPGVVWQMTDPNGVVFDRPDVQQVQFGQQMLQMWMSFNADMGGAPAILSGSKGASTATGSQILQKQAQIPLQDVVEDIEADVMVRLMRATWMMEQQYRDNKIMLRIAGGETMVVSPEDFAIDPDFRWLASSQAMNAAQRNQQAITLLQTLAGPTLQSLQQAGYSYDPAPLIEKLWNDGMGFRGFDRIIAKLPPPPPQMPGMPPGGMPGMAPPQAGGGGNALPPMSAGAPPPQDDRVRSSLEQVTGEQDAPDMAQGEGEDFMNTRSEADQLAAQMGVLR